MTTSMPHIHNNPSESTSHNDDDAVPSKGLDPSTTPYLTYEERAKQNGMRYTVCDVPPLGLTIFLGVQHYLTMLVRIIERFFFSIRICICVLLLLLLLCRVGSIMLPLLPKRYYLEGIEKMHPFFATLYLPHTFTLTHTCWLNRALPS
jgi:hypothetical protein